VLVKLLISPALITRTICVTIRVYIFCDKHSQREGCGCKPILFLQNLAKVVSKKLTVVFEVAKRKAALIQRDFAEFWNNWEARWGK